MRCFIAVPVPQAERELLALVARDAADAVPREQARIGWVKPEGMHLTFLFLGEIDRETADRAGSLLDRAAGPADPFSIGFSGIDQFPPRGKARVIHVPIRQGAAECVRLHGMIADAFRDIVPPEPRPFSPHITLARVKEGTIRAEQISSTAAVEGYFRADRIVLFRSHLHPTGAQYEELHTTVFSGR